MIEDTDKELKGITCYVCGEDLARKYKNDTTQQSDLNASKVNFPEMVLWNGNTKEVCGDCYKAYIEGLEEYAKNQHHSKLGTVAFRGQK